MYRDMEFIEYAPLYQLEREAYVLSIGTKQEEIKQEKKWKGKEKLRS